MQIFRNKGVDKFEIKSSDNGRFPQNDGKRVSN